MARKKPAPDALDIIDEMAKGPTLNRFFDNNPRKLSEQDLRELIDFNRSERATIEKDED